MFLYKQFSVLTISTIWSQREKIFLSSNKNLFKLTWVYELKNPKNISLKKQFYCSAEMKSCHSNHLSLS